VALVGGDDRVVGAAAGSLDNGHIDDVVMVRSTSQLADMAPVS
jgi:hypothetical protein